MLPNLPTPSFPPFPHFPTQNRWSKHGTFIFRERLKRRGPDFGQNISRPHQQPADLGTRNVPRPSTFRSGTGQSSSGTPDQMVRLVTNLSHGRLQFSTSAVKDLLDFRSVRSSEVPERFRVLEGRQCRILNFGLLQFKSFRTPKVSGRGFFRPGCERSRHQNPFNELMNMEAKGVDILSLCYYYSTSSSPVPLLTCTSEHSVQVVTQTGYLLSSICSR